MTHRTRIPWRGSMQLVVPGQEPIIAATISDISESGWGLDFDRPLDAGVMAEIPVTDSKAAG